MKQIKSWLIQILGRKQYLRLLSRVYLTGFRLGWLQNNPAYRTHYFVRKLIKPQQTILDIGANLGYYTTEFARLTGPAGKIFAVEPIPLYRQILEANTQKWPQVAILPYALGETEGRISMGLPFADQHRHGLMKVLSDDEKQKAPEIFEVELKHPGHLFSQIDEIHYIKCDIEGYEVPVIPAMKEVILRHMPLLQIETDGENKKVLHRLLNDWGYLLYYVGAKGLTPYPDAEAPLPADLIAIPKSSLSSFESLIEK